MQTSRLIRLTCSLVAVACMAEPLSAAMPPGSIRALTASGKIVWAVGDRSTVLRSQDGGATFEAVPCPVLADWRGVTASGPSAVVLAGGAPAPGLDGLARGVVARSDDGGATWTISTDKLPGMLYGLTGGADGSPIVAWGQASDACPSGLWQSATGQLFAPIASRTMGGILAGHFSPPTLGWLVGQGHRIVTVRQLAELGRASSIIDNPNSLRAVQNTADEAAWAAGDDGSVMFKQPGELEFIFAELRLPGPLRRLADFEAVAFYNGQQGLVGGGLLGSMQYTDNGGRTFVQRPAPVGSPIHAMLITPDGAVLAGGDHGRIWRSTDAAGTWTLSTGRAGTDLLVIASPADASIYPMLAAHASSGANVTVCFLAAPDDRPTLPQRQALEQACSLAGAACIVLHDFRSLAVQAPQEESLPSEGAAHERFTAQDVLAQWQRQLDTPGRETALRHLAAAIRLTRPTVLATGVTGELAQARGPIAEAYLAGELALQASRQAGDEQAFPELSAVHLPAHAVKRTAWGLATNAQFRPPWDSARAIRPAPGSSAWQAWEYPQDSPDCLDMLALRAMAPLPWLALRSRPAGSIVYTVQDADGPTSPPKSHRLLTDGLAPGVFYQLDAKAGRADPAASGATLAMAERTSRSISAALPSLVDQADSNKLDALPADMIYLAWQRLCEQGRLTEAVEAREAFLQHGHAHPLFAQTNVAALAQNVSEEWKIHLARQGIPRPTSPQTLTSAADAMEQWTDWMSHPATQMLMGRTRAWLNRPEPARKAWQRLATAPLTPDWPLLAKTELAVPQGLRTAAGNRRQLDLLPSLGPVKLDGRLNEPLWRVAPSTPLADSNSLPPPAEWKVDFRAAAVGPQLVLSFSLPQWDRMPAPLPPAGASTSPEASMWRENPDVPVWDDDPAPSAGKDAQPPAAPAERTPTSSYFPPRENSPAPAAALPGQPPQWQIQVGVDIDRDGWTDVRFTCDNTGQRAATLHTRGAPPARIADDAFAVQAVNEAGRYTFELAVPLAQLGYAATEDSLLAFQVRLTAEPPSGNTRRYYFSPQPDARMQPHRYGLLLIARSAAATADRAGEKGTKGVETKEGSRAPG